MKMNKDKDYTSDSDTSDDDFCPDDLKNAGNSDLSEESSDDEIDDDQYDDNEEQSKSMKKIKRTKKQATKNKLNNTHSDALQKSNEGDVARRRTRQNNEQINTAKVQNEKLGLESDDEDKQRADALWADFLGDVKETKECNVEKKKIPTILNSVSDKESSCSSFISNGDTSKITSDNKMNGSNAKEITITEIMDFAGEEIKVEKIIKTDSIKENKLTTETSNISTITTTSPRGLMAIGNKRSSSSAGSGLGSILNQIGKKKKLSVLEKTKLDWNSFKQDEGIEEELQTFNKGKDGYLERQDFLERTDLRQFEIERNLRQTKRK